MSRVSSLGIHTPTALPYCISEGLLPDPAPSNSYTWTTGYPHEELLTTPNAVIWSQGGIIRRVFRYDVEKEPVVQAVLTWFPSGGPLEIVGQHAGVDVDDVDSGGDNVGYISGESDKNKRKPDWGDEVKSKKRLSTWNSKTRSYALQLGSFPKARGLGGVQEGSGSVGSADVTEVDDEITEEQTKGAKVRALVVFLKTQAFAYYLTSAMHVIHLPFEIQHAMPTSRGLILQRKYPVPPQPLGSFMTASSFTTKPPATTKDSPLLFTLTDPLSEVGLVMSTMNTPCLDGLMFISPSSEVEYSNRENLSSSGSVVDNPEVLFAVTHNPERTHLTIWQVRYVPQDQPVNIQRRTSSTSGTLSKRRSSYGVGTGATTPVAVGGASSVASSATIGAKSGRDPGGASTLNNLGDDFETTGRRSSRRVSSMVARADLSGNHDGGHRFSDVSNSFGASFGAPPAPQNTMLSDDDLPVDDLLNELNMGSLGIGMDELGAYDGEGLKQEVLMHKIESLPSKLQESDRGLGYSARVFTLRAPSSAVAAAVTGKETASMKVSLFILNRSETTLIQFNFHIQIHSTAPKGYSRKSNTKFNAAAMGYTSVLADTLRRNDVLDAIKIQDGSVQKVLILTGCGKILIYSPWFTSTIEISLPATLVRWNPNFVGNGGSRRGGRKKREFSRNLSTMPESYQRLEYADLSGRVTIVDGEGVGHRISICLSPRESSTKSCIETLRVVLGGAVGFNAGEGVLCIWMKIARWLQATSDPEAGFTQDAGGISPDEEWQALVVAIFLIVLPSIPEPKPQSRRKSAFVRSSSMIADKDWEEWVAHQGEWGSSHDFLRIPAWKWMIEEQDETLSAQQQSQAKGRGSLGAGHEGQLKNKFITECIFLGRNYLKSPAGEDFYELLFGKSSDPVEGRRSAMATVLVALHLLREEWKLDALMEGPARRLCPVLRQIAAWLGWNKWKEEYMLEDFEMTGWAYNDDISMQSVGMQSEPFGPPDIYEWLMACIKGLSPGPFMVMQDIVAPPNTKQSGSYVSQRLRNPLSPPPPPSPFPTQHRVFSKLTPRTLAIASLYTVLSTPDATDLDVVEKMVELNMALASLQRLPEGVGVPLREAIARCQEQPPTTWGVRELELVGRKDLRMLIEPSKGRREHGTKWQSTPTHEAVRDIHFMCGSTFEAETIGSYDPMAEHDRQAVSRLLFKEDRRIYEAARLLQSAKPALAKCVPEPHWNEQELMVKYREIASCVAVRTLAVATGRGLFQFSARIPLLTERFPIIGFNLTCVIQPSNTTVSADKAAFTEDKVCWAFFHAGAAAGVSISREAKDIDTSWIVFNKPPELTSRHAGFLLGLGLNGHLRNIAKWHAFNYLTPKHTMVSIGLLLGISASFLGTMDTNITKLLSVHITGLLPPGSADLNISPLVQTAGIMGIGLLYSNTQHRRMTEVMLNEIEHVEIPETCGPMDTLREEGYRLSAGFALGLINLGSGTDMRGLHDMRLVERLLALSVGSKKITEVHILDKASAGATIALALIFMKTHDETVAKKIDIPDTAHLFDYVRPDLFLLRTVARNLIMWNQIRPTFEWIRSRLSPFHRERYRMTTTRNLDSEDLPFYNIIAGLCLSIALRFAGSGDLGVRDVLVHYLDEFIRLCSLPALNHDQKLARTTVRNCQDLVALSASTVMAGTGDIVIFRRLRKLHGRTEADVPYGSHLAAHIAIGVVFLGNGSYTFGTQNIAVASLLCAFYPLFPTTPLDNKCHLQAFRYFWVLAVENRCIVPRDVETFRPTQIPITISLKNGQEVNRIAPCLLPDLSSIATVTTTSPAHWTVVLDFLNSEAHRRGFERSQSIFVHKRSAHASQSTVFQAALQALDDDENLKAPLEWIGQLPAFAGMDKAEKALVIREGANGGGECIDERLELEYALRSSMNRSRLRGVAVVASRKEKSSDYRSSSGGLWVDAETVGDLRAGIWIAGGGGLLEN